MRITGGEWKSRSIEAPEGRDVTRPTTDRVREAMCSMLYSACGLNFDGVAALDAYAGSGALGLELLSRGAKHVTFVDIDKGAASRVERNCKALGASNSSYTALRADSAFLAQRPGIKGGPFGIILLDPPYATPATVICELVENLVATANLDERALILYERSNSAPTLEPKGFTLLKSKRYGQTAVDLLRKD